MCHREVASKLLKGTWTVYRSTWDWRRLTTLPWSSSVTKSTWNVTGKIIQLKTKKCHFERGPKVESSRLKQMCSDRCQLLDWLVCFQGQLVLFLFHFLFPLFFFYVRTTCRQISKAEGSSLAHFYNAAFFETSAAEEYNCVERVFHEAIRGASLKTLASALLFIFTLSLAIVCWFHFFLFFSRRSSPGARTVYADTKFVHCQQRRL